MADRHPIGRLTPTENRGPSLPMRVISAFAGAQARRAEGRTVALESSRASGDRLMKILPVPRGVTETAESIAGIPVVRFTAPGSVGTMMYLFGGAYVMGQARSAVYLAGICRNGGPEIVSVAYRLAPEHPYPAAVEDALTVYRELVRTQGANNLIVIGDSAGGGLALLMLQQARAEGVAMPVAVVAGYPWADLTMSGTHSHSNIGRDQLVRSELVRYAAMFAGDLDPASAEVSSAFGSFAGFPRTYIPVGTADLLLDASRSVAASMADEGVDVILDEWPGAVHGFTGLPFAEGRRYRRRLDQFVRMALPRETERRFTSRGDYRSAVG